MIELIENPITASLDILAYNVANLDVKDILTLKEHKGRALLENCNYDMNQIVENIKLIPTTKGIKIVLSRRALLPTRRAETVDLRKEKQLGSPFFTQDGNAQANNGTADSNQDPLSPKGAFDERVDE